MDLSLDRLRWSDLALALGVGLVGLWQMARLGYAGGSSLFIVMAMTVAAGSYRVLPGLALALSWAASLVQVSAQLEVTLVQLATVIVAYGTARYGSRVTLWCSGLSIPVGSVIALAYVQTHGYARLVGLGRDLLPAEVTSLTTAFLLVVVLLATPWALGLLLRLSDQSRQARAEREQADLDAARAKEIADLRAEQTRLARDVHDVVGHSLAVILAQADSVEFMPDDDIDRIRAALANISTSARRSLGDVRQVLSSTGDAGDAFSRTAGGLDSLIEGVRVAGNDIESQVDGQPRPLPPELDVVAFHVLQEMLTNALKHGRRGAEIIVRRSWGQDELRIEVRNVIDRPSGTTAPGIGQLGMQRRLESVGGRLDVRTEDATRSVAGTTPRAKSDEPIFVAVAWVPLRPSGGST